MAWPGAGYHRQAAAWAWLVGHRESRQPIEALCHQVAMLRSFAVVTHCAVLNEARA